MSVWLKNFLKKDKKEVFLITLFYYDKVSFFLLFLYLGLRSCDDLLPNHSKFWSRKWRNKIVFWVFHVLFMGNCPLDTENVNNSVSTGHTIPQSI